MLHLAHMIERRFGVPAQRIALLLGSLSALALAAGLALALR